jgi:molybdenum cofactor synthesis domain-containing protein
MPDTGAMHPLGELTSVERAVALILSKVRAIDRVETVPLSAAAGRILAEEVRSPADSPASDRSRMDGFAVTASDLAGLAPGQTRALKVVGKSLAGAPFGRALESMACTEIATGAELPMRADAVVPVEDVRILDGGARAEFSSSPPRGLFVLARASDYRAGEVLLRSGDFMSGAKVGASASAGVLSVTVRSRPRILIVPTGDEVRPAHETIQDSQVRESNSHALAAFVTLRGGAPEVHGIVPDVLDQVASALREAMTYDAAVFTGGSSAGEKDFLGQAVKGAGQVAFHGLALRPGKPILFGQVANAPVLGLPGNPTSCMVGAHLFLDRILQGLTGERAPPLTATRVPLNGDVSGFVKGDDMLSIVLVRLKDGKAEPLLRDSMSVTGASAADGYFVVGPGKPAPASGETVAVLLLR